jgi:hypothetical protein
VFFFSGMIQSIPEITGFASSEIRIYRCFSTPCRFMDGNYLAMLAIASEQRGNKSIIGPVS